MVTVSGVPTRGPVVELLLVTTDDKKPNREDVALYERGRAPYKLPVALDVMSAVVDPTGAGDSVAAVFTLALTAGAIAWFQFRKLSPHLRRKISAENQAEDLRLSQTP